MVTNDWQKIGEDIRNSVQSAIDKNDYSNISNDIQRAVGDAVDNVRISVSSAINAANVAYAQGQNAQREKYNTAKANLANSRADIRIPSPTPLAKPDRLRVYEERHPHNRPRVYAERPRGAVAGTLKMVFGFTLMTFFYGAAIVTSIIASLFGRANFAGLTWLVLGLASMGVGLNGVKQHGLVKRFRTYTRLIGNKEYCEIAALAKATQHSQSFVRRDLKRMIKRNMFLEAHFDEKEVNFMITDDTYQQYRQTIAARDEQRLLEQSRIQSIDSNISEEHLKIREEGNLYIRRIREANGAIPGEIISNKLYRLENIMQTIFNEVDKHPETAAELHKFMDYYFPTTMKLVDAYRELDSRNVHGENTLNTKTEIENALDIISDAFEKLLDKLFTERAWDISSDISVMKTMLAQDGLVNS